MVGQARRSSGRQAARAIPAEVSSAPMNRRKVPVDAERLAKLVLGAGVALWLWFQMMGDAATATAGPRSTGAAMTGAPYRDPKLPVEKRVADLLQRMTLAEKVAQLGSVNWDKNRL